MILMPLFCDDLLTFQCTYEINISALSLNDYLTDDSRKTEHQERLIS